MVSLRFSPDLWLFCLDTSVDLVSAVVCVMVVCDSVDIVSESCVLKESPDTIVESSCWPLVGGRRLGSAPVMKGPSVLALVEVTVDSVSGDGDLCLELEE